MPMNLEFNEEFMQKMAFSPYSETLWTISPPALNKLISDFQVY